LDGKLERENSEESIKNSKKFIYAALADGKCFFANDYHADSKGFRFYAEADDKIFQMGDYIDSISNKIVLKVLLPVQDGEIRLIRNGEQIDETTDKSAQFDIDEKGAYRVEVYIHNKAWIFANHIRIGL
jgi:hypothetical protein